MSVALAVRLGAASETVPADDALEPASLCRGDDVDQLTGAELGNVEPLAALVRRDVRRRELAQVAEVTDVLQVPARRPVGLLGLAEAELDGLIAVGRCRLELGDDARPDLQDRHRHKPALPTKVVGHAYFSA